MATESSNPFAPPRSAVKDVDGDEALELASRRRAWGPSCSMALSPSSGSYPPTS
jgi:hypothetical protein